MSFLTSIRAGSRRAMQTSYIIPSTPAFSTSAAQRGLKESDKGQPPPNILHMSISRAKLMKLTKHTDRDDDLPNIYESEKERQLKGSKEGKAEWNSDLASNSEAFV